MRIASTLLSQDLSNIALSIQSKTSKHVEQALAKTSRNIDDFMALISPAAAPYAEEMAMQSQALTRARFGNTMGLFVPLYLANLCANECTYCGFTMSNKIKRTVLNLSQIEKEIAAITDLGFSQVLLVTGEHEQKVGMPYFSEVLPSIRDSVSNVMMEVQPLPQKDYETLKSLGVDAVLVYQETYNPQEYARYHTRGKKQDFLWRLQASDRIGAAGIDKIGIGALLGLGDWRTDSVMTALHGQLIQQHYWRSRVAISFPRLRQCEGNTNDAANLLTQQFPNETQLLQLICAHRLFNPQAELSLSTRESARFRDGVLPLGITSMSAGSQTQPGGYSAPSEALNQFDIDDTRPVNSVAAVIEAKGLEPVWKDWMAFS
ncbi:2-iminoacetate synthase ThiH [Alteromonas sp. MMG017]|uniref:2-iminoacetate synthase ThiH n=1 Tax=Alteromonas sp. MMG017 TaxID=2822692 RepID=UPI001B3A551E|nr:2-iminoacetate synthase ThiH [Alteromonas sp. MMG017]MBQ4828041.1 2-iminoacetate synthase ThiH [Alteromonas sp. MMG017]